MVAESSKPDAGSLVRATHKRRPTYKARKGSLINYDKKKHEDKDEGDDDDDDEGPLQSTKHSAHGSSHTVDSAAAGLYSTAKRGVSTPRPSTRALCSP